MGMIAGATLLCSLAFQTAGSVLSHTWPAIVTAGLLVTVVLTAFLYRELRMSYETWRTFHNVLALAALTAVFLQALLAIPGTGKGPIGASLALYFAAGVAAYVQHRVVGPVTRRKNLYRVDRVERETHNVWNLTLKPPDGAARFDFMPGQFQFLTFHKGRGEEHPFTISSSPALPGVHTATIKESGDFTRGIGMVRAGDLLAVQAPFGRFSYLLHPQEKDIVFIAGGIGITPIMSMLRHMRDSAAEMDVHLLYANQSEEDIVFKKELEELASEKAPRLRVTHVLDRPGEGWTGERGRIDLPMIKKNVSGDLQAKAFYLCGPPPMMNALITSLIENGVPSRQVRTERFSL
jgi:predicted ferric reductase